jgi:CheY-like chemotaxis protein
VDTERDVAFVWRPRGPRPEVCVPILEMRGWVSVATCILCWQTARAEKSNQYTPMSYETHRPACRLFVSYLTVYPHIPPGSLARRRRPSARMLTPELVPRMRVRICRQPPRAIDGVSLEHFRAGLVYDVGTQIASVFLAEGWAEPADEGESSRTNQPSGRVSALVLVVDDDTDLRKLTASILVGNGYSVIEAQDGREGIARLTQDSPDLVVLDLNMPVMDGWRFRAEQQRLPDGRLASIPVLLVTAAEGAGAHTATLKAVGLVEKPFDPERLVGAIKTALRR